MKRFLSLVLCLVMIMSIVTTSTITVSAASVSDLKFTLNDDGKSYSVEARNQSLKGKLVIPSKFSGYRVTNISNSAFYGCSDLTSVTIPDSVKNIGNSAFYGCDSLVSVTIGDGVTCINHYAFNGCVSLESVTIGNNVTNIGKAAFEDCSRLTAVTFPNSVKNIDSRAFGDCESLKTIRMGNGITSIGSDAFYSCTSLATVYITDMRAWCNIEFANNLANPLYCGPDFYLNGKLLIDIVIPSGVTVILPNAFCGYKNLRAVLLPDSLIAICHKSFFNCKKLTSITIPEKVQGIDSNAFAYCESLNYVLFNNKITVIGDSAFSECKNIKKTYYTGNVAEWNNIDISDGNEPLYNKVVFNYDSRKPIPPVLSGISNTDVGVKITWGKVSGADSYEVYRKVKGGSYSKVGTTKKTYFTDKKAKSGKQYYYVVKAVNEAGKSSSSSYKTIKYLADPTLKTPTSTKSGVTLKWSKVTGAQGYIIYRKTGSGSYTKLKTEKGVSNLSYVDKSAKKNNKYTYKVKAYYGKTYSAYSNTKTVKDKY